MKHDYCAEYGDVLLRPLHRYDIEFLRLWRNRADVSRYLSKVGNITEKKQQEWFNEYIQNMDVIFWAIDYQRKRTVGTVALYEMCDKECQIGKIVIGEDSARGHNLSRLSFLMAMGIGIKYFGIEKFSLSVHEANKAAITIYSKIGFQKCGSHNFGGGIEFDMKIEKERLIHENPEISEVKLFTENETEVHSVWGGYFMID